jgi:hypothetical protein
MQLYTYIYICAMRLLRAPRMNVYLGILAPPFVVGEDVGILDVAARLGHNRRHCVAPGLVMSGFFVPDRIIGRAVNSDQHALSGLNHRFCPPAPFYRAFASCTTGPNPDLDDQVLAYST